MKNTMVIENLSFLHHQPGFPMLIGPMTSPSINLIRPSTLIYRQKMYITNIVIKIGSKNAKSWLEVYVV